MASSLERVDTLVSMSMEYVVKNLGMYLAHDFESLRLLPPKIKYCMLRKLTAASRFSANLDFKKALSAVIYSNLKCINLSLVELDDETLDVLSNCHNLRSVYLTKFINNILSPKALVKFLTPLKQLYLLEISYCAGVTDDVLITLSKNCPLLASLDVSGCANISDVGLEEIAKLENLLWLGLTFTRITNNAIEKLATGPSGSKIKELRVANCLNLDGRILHIITDNCHSIEILDFYNIPPQDTGRTSAFSSENGLLKQLKQLTWTIRL